jgi:cell division protease FtsH
MRHPLKINLLWLLLLITFIFTYRMIAQQQNDSREVRWGELIAFINEGYISELKVQGELIEAQLTDEAFTILSQQPQYDYVLPKFTVTGPRNGLGEKLRERLEQLDEKNEIRFNYQAEEKETFLQAFVISWLPMIVLLVIFFVFMRQLQGNSGRAMSFGKSKARLLNENQKKVTFSDVAGVEEAKEELEEVVEFLKNPLKFTKLGGRIPKGVLLMGPPGTGKTLLARGVAGEADVPFYSISGSDFVEMFVGVGASRVRDLFEQAKKSSPCIIFIDEIDAVGRQRGAGLGGGHDEREQTLNQLLVEMDGFEHNEGVILIAATNRPDVLDPALLRPGRFDRRVVVNRPDVSGREKILNVHTRKVPLDDNIDLMTIAKGTPGFSGADLENLVNEAALWAAREDQDRVFMKDFESAKDKVLMGAERRSMIISDREKKTTAYHEAGHALVAILLPGTDPVHKVTIIPRGRALGVTQQLPQEDRLSMTKDFAEKRIAILMGGRIAEEIIFDQLTTGAGQDIEMATETARSMVCQWGMSKALGPLAFGQKNEQVFLGRDMGNSRNYSDETARQIDQEVYNIITEGYDRARKLIEDNIDKLEEIAQALLERETLDANDIKCLIKGVPLPEVEVPTPQENVSSPSDEAAAPQDDSEPEPLISPLVQPSTSSYSDALEQAELTDALTKEANSTLDQIGLSDEGLSSQKQSTTDQAQETPSIDPDDLPESLLGPRES